MIENIEVNGHKLEFIRYATNKEAHPSKFGYVNEDAQEFCDGCIIAKRLDTNEDVLLWLLHNMTWIVSRADKNYEKHKRELV